ncbi:MAG TPA: hypothetical protein VFK18_01970 [Luteimonas sp.]|nr:hypothetical protein [Luteimonas sp.]
MSLVGKLTVTPLLYACGALALLCVGLGTALALARAEVRTVTAEAGATYEELQSAQVERDAWKDKANAASSANASCTQGIESLTVTLDRQQKACRAAQAANQQAIAAARAEAADADAALQRFIAQFRAQTPETDCGRALAALDTVCPALEGY